MKFSIGTEIKESLSIINVQIFWENENFLQVFWEKIRLVEHTLTSYFFQPECKFGLVHTLLNSCSNFWNFILKMTS